MADRVPLICGNWKMNTTPSSAVPLAAAIIAGVSASTQAEVAVCPPYPMLGSVGATLTGSPVTLGAQDCHVSESGAHTGDVSALMLAETGCAYVIVGHSERRADHGEADADVAAKAQAALKAGLTPIICVGESLAQREAGQAVAVVSEQIKGSVPSDLAGDQIVIAYEPVWAIGTGKTASPSDVAEMHQAMRETLTSVVSDAAKTRLLYGGSVKPDNAAELLALDNVDGALVGGAALKAESFLAIVNAA